jgi:hypothetical protein
MTHMVVGNFECLRYVIDIISVIYLSDSLNGKFPSSLSLGVCVCVCMHVFVLPIHV